MNTDNMQACATTAAPEANAQALRPIRPSLRFFHASPKGTGCAVKFALHPAHDADDGSIFATAAQQVAIASRMGPTPTYARFDWENAICVKLDFGDLCQILQVFRGECEDLGNGQGLIHVSTRGTTRIHLRHLLEPVTGYSFEVYRTAPDGTESRAHILFSSAEALGLTEAISGSLSIVGFGIPMVIPHDTSAYKAANRERRNVRAA